MSETFFDDVAGPIPFAGLGSSDALAYKVYEPDRLVLGKRMADHLRISVCLWHSFAWPGSDVFGSGTFDRPWNETGLEPLEAARTKVDAAFEFLVKLGVPFFAFHDRDVAPEGGSYREILALGNPAVWWPGLLALGAMFVSWGRSGWGLGRPEPVILASAVATYLPWLILSGDRSQTFLWYFLPTVPFLCLALGTLAARAWDRMAGRVAVITYGAVVLASFAFYVPLLTALPLDPDAWRTRILFRDCDRNGAPTQSLPDDSTSQGEPPQGWCWI